MNEQDRIIVAKHYDQQRCAVIEAATKDVRYQVSIAIEAAEVNRLHVSREKVDIACDNYARAINRVKKSIERFEAP